MVFGAWRSQFDFDAPGLSVRQRLERLQYAAMLAADRCSEEGTLQELGFAISECRQLLGMETLEGEAAEAERVGQRVERIRRVVLYYEGPLARLNRLYWWVPCSLGLLVMAGCLARCVFAL